MSKTPPQVADQEDDNGIDGDDDGDMVDVINVSPQVARFQLDGMRYKLKPGQVSQCRATYARPMKLRPGADPIPSVIDRETNGRVLCVEDPRAKKALGARLAASAPATA